jgi:hypothetical protein
MYTTIKRYRTAAIMTVAAAAVSLAFAATPASAQVVPAAPDPPVNVWSCPTSVGDIAQVLRNEEFIPQAAKNFAVLTRRACLYGH